MLVVSNLNVQYLQVELQDIMNIRVQDTLRIGNRIPPVEALLKENHLAVQVLGKYDKDIKA